MMVRLRWLYIAVAVGAVFGHLAKPPGLWVMVGGWLWAFAFDKWVSPWLDRKAGRP